MDEWDIGFWCRYCGKNFGNNPQKLAVHMAKKCRILKPTSRNV